jgi:hypothetical protein
MVALTATVNKDTDSCCRPGDITVTPVPSGFMIGRAMPQIGPGPWWQYVKVVAEYDDAMQLATQLAREDNARAWFHLQNDEYDEIK